MAHKLTLSEVVDKYFIYNGIDKKKYFARHLVLCGDVWRDLYIDTLGVMKSKWLPLRIKSGKLYVELPEDVERICSLNTQDSCGNAIPLYFNRNFQVEQKPVNQCECGCECSGLIEEMQQVIPTTRLVFTDNNVDYFEKKWVTLCKNGDILEYRELPVKKFNDRVGDSGDYNEDFNNDFSIGNPFANYEIVTEILTEKKCNIAVKECGCPLSTVENERLICEHCGPYLNPALSCGVKRCDTFLSESQPKNVGEAIISDCETLMYVRKLSKETDYLLFVYQSNGKCDYGSNCVPEKALMALWTGIDYRKKMFNNSYNFTQQEAARIAYNREVNNLITFDNKITLEFLNDVQHSPIKW